MGKAWIASPKRLEFAAHVVSENEWRRIRAKTDLKVDIVYVPLHAHAAQLKRDN